MDTSGGILTQSTARDASHTMAGFLQRFPIHVLNLGDLAGYVHELLLQRNLGAFSNPIGWV